MSQPQTIPLATIAKLLCVTERRVQQMADKGIIPAPEKRGEYELVGCVQGYIQFLQSADRQGTSGSDEMMDAKERQAKARAEIMEMKAAQMKGDLVWAEDVRTALCNVLALFKSALRTIPSDIAPEVRMSKSDGQAEKTIREKIDGTLDELSRAIVTIIPRCPGGAEPENAAGVIAESGGAAAEHHDQPMG
jgi:phage terminase Nu1 subunit (DNA packaging protein)